MSERKEIIAKFSRKAGVSKVNAGVYLAMLLEIIQAILARTGEVKLPGFGTFKARAIPPREGVNPLTGEKTTFSPGVRVGFKPGRPLKEGVMKGSFLKGRLEREKGSRRVKAGGSTRKARPATRAGRRRR